MIVNKISYSYRNKPAITCKVISIFTGNPNSWAAESHQQDSQKYGQQNYDDVNRQVDSENNKNDDSLERGVHALSLADKTPGDGGAPEAVSQTTHDAGPSEGLTLVSQPKKSMSWANIASKPAKQLPTRRKEKTVLTSRHMDIGTWDNKNGPGAKPSAPLPAPRPAWEPPRTSARTTTTYTSTAAPQTPNPAATTTTAAPTTDPASTPTTTASSATSTADTTASTSATAVSTSASTTSTSTLSESIPTLSPSNPTTPAATPAPTPTPPPTPHHHQTEHHQHQQYSQKTREQQPQQQLPQPQQMPPQYAVAQHHTMPPPGNMQMPLNAPKQHLLQHHHQDQAPPQHQHNRSSLSPKPAHHQQATPPHPMEEKMPQVTSHMGRPAQQDAHQQNVQPTHGHDNNLSSSDKSPAPDASLELLHESPRPEESSSPILEDLRQRNKYNPSELSLDTTNARFFVIKSYSEDDVHRAIKYEIWCSTEHGNKRLDQAFKDQAERNAPLYLLFSVNGTGHFCGIAEMLSCVDYSSSASVWAQDKWKGQFKVKWIYVKDVPNTQLRHIKLENNENKPVTKSRDTQEVLPDKGRQVLQIIHSFRHSSSIFDDFTHYERRQEEIKSKRNNMDGSSDDGRPMDYHRNHDQQQPYYGGHNYGGRGGRGRGYHHNNYHPQHYGNYNAGPGGGRGYGRGHYGGGHHDGLA
ncbi:hypothetical protein HAZT_HAZT003035 [Hyalella azteca]|uniref:YTH domain-containing protein n=1 Tax=Hyalella azteca TaxID=294128 RepID=A0A6A0GU15_HYAAZ|nr:hypothetical protein HAZT_HAZT003035 [Hyalella azteca]